MLTRLLRGEEHKDFDTGVRLQKEVNKNDVKAQKEQTVKDEVTRALAESRVMLCEIVRARLSERSACANTSRFVMSNWPAARKRERQLCCVQRRILLKTRCIRLQV